MTIADVRLATSRRTVFTGAGILLFALLMAALRPWDLTNGFLIGAPFGRDFVNFWLGGLLAIQHRLDLLIDLSAYNDVLLDTFHHAPLPPFVYSYPPHSLLFTVPFAALPYVPAVVIWTALNVAAIAASARLLTREVSLVFVACLSPAVLVMVLYGHFGGALALLATVCLLRAQSHPALAGLCLALTTVKPQFALVLGLFLLVTGCWRALLWSVAPTALLLALSIAAFGLQPWINYVAWTLPFHAALLSDFKIEMLRTAISVYAGARMAGLPGWVAYAAQYAFGAVVFWKAAVQYRRDGANARTIALAILAALAALPYYNAYDLAIAAPAVTVALLGYSATPLLASAPAALLWLAPVFALPFGVMALPITPLLVAVPLLLALFSSPQTRRQLAANPI
jgi:alpha-1,2-mannosyltransferase